jgi:hypothetical protein
VTKRKKKNYKMTYSKATLHLHNFFLIDFFANKPRVYKKINKIKLYLDKIFTRLWALQCCSHTQDREITQVPLTFD